MATISSTIKLNDRMSNALQKIQNNLQNTMNVMAQVNVQVNNTTNNIQNFAPAAVRGGSGIESLTSKIKGLIVTLGGLAAARKTLDLSDNLTSTSARLSMVGSAFKEAGFDTEAFTKKIYAAANASRGSFDTMASLVSRLGMNATDSFGSTDELVKFAENVQKIMTISGASTTEAANAELQLSQALASGVLRGDELNSIFEQSPMLIQKIADYMGVPMGQIRSMASEGEITADIVKAAVLGATEEINEQFSQMPMTFGQIMTQLGNVAQQKFTPILNRINQALNSARGQQIITGLINAMSAAADIANKAMDKLGDALEWCYENSEKVTNALKILVAAVLAYNTLSAIAAGLTTAFSVAQGVASAAHGIYTAATAAATAGQSAFNAALYACPITWIVALIMVLIVAFTALAYVIADKVAKSGGTATSVFAVLCGWISNAIATGQDFMMICGTIATNITNVFTNMVASLQWAFWGLLEVVTNVVLGIINMINKIPGVNIDTSGLASAAAEYAQNRANAAASIKGLQGFGEFKTPGAYDRGAAWGNEKWSQLTSLKDKLFSGTGLDELGDGMLGEITSGLDSIADSTGDTAGSTKAINSKLDDTEEDLKYLCDIAERDAINRFTTASIAVDMVNNNSISSGLDLDGVIDGLAGRLQTSMAMIAEGA